MSIYFFLTKFRKTTNHNITIDKEKLEQIFRNHSIVNSQGSIADELDERRAKD